METSFERTRLTFARLSLVVGTLLFAVKLLAWWWTGSAAILSDALESIVNVVAAAFALYSVGLSGKPADHDHPYGHGKIEFLSAAFEGGLVFVAGALILIESVRHLVAGVALQRLEGGLVLVVFAAIVNLVLGLALIRVGKRTHSLALEADGQHLLTDVWTSAMVVVGLGLVLATGESWLDPVVAILAALNILRIGWRLVRGAIRGIMDEADPEDLRIVSKALLELEDPRLRGWKRLRSRHQGPLHHVDLTILVAADATVAVGHRLALAVEERIRDVLGEAEVICHVEPEGAEKNLPK